MVAAHETGRRGAIATVAFAMVASVILYVDGAASQRIPTQGPPISGGTTVSFDVQSIQNNYSELVGDLIVSPGPALLDPVTNGLRQDLAVRRSCRNART